MITIYSITFTPALNNFSTGYLLGVLCDKITVAITCKAEWIAAAGPTAQSQEMAFLASDDSVTWEGGSFEALGFIVGDTIAIAGTASNNGNFTVTYVLGNILKVTAGFVNETAQAGTISGTTPMKFANLKYNLIENSQSDDFNSLVDGNENKLIAATEIDWNSATPIAMNPMGVLRSNVIGSATIQGAITLNTFIILQTIYVNPFFLTADLANMNGGIPPDYFLESLCLKYIYNVEMTRSELDPNNKHVSPGILNLGNTGWFDENFNTGSKKFSIDSVVFKVDGVVVDNPDYNQVTDFEITISSVSSTFTGTMTNKFAVNHFILPESESEYIDTTTDMATNFMFDQVIISVEDTVTQSANLATAKQVLKDVKYHYTSTSSGFFTGKIDLSSAYKARVDDLINKQLILSVIVQDEASVVSQTNKVNLKHLTAYDTDASNDTVGTISTTFNYFPKISTSVSDPGVFLEDTLRGNSLLSIDITDDALFDSVQIFIKAEKNTGESFILEQKDFSFDTVVVQSGIQQVNITENRGFILGDGNPFNVVSLTRRADLDSGNVKKYQLLYPFKIRWEDFKKLSGVDTEFFDVAEENNGYNHEWNRYFAQSGWILKYIVQSNIIESGFTNEIVEETDFSGAYDYNAATDWTYSIKIYDIDTDTEIPNNVLSDKTVRVEAVFTKISGDVPDLADVDGMIEYEPFEQGGVNVIRSINTTYEHEAGSPFISLLGTKLLKKEKAANVFTFSANIDGTMLTGSPKLSARIYQVGIPPLGGYKEFQDEEFFEFMDGEPYEFM